MTDSSLQFIAAHCGPPQLITARTAAHCGSLQLTAAHDSALQIITNHCSPLQLRITLHCSSLQFITLHYSSLQLIAAHGSSHAARDSTLHLTADRCSLQLTQFMTAHCNSLRGGVGVI